MTEFAAAEYRCNLCGEPAGRVEVVPSPNSPGRKRLVLSVFISTWEQASADATYAAAAEALRGGDPRALWALNAEWAPFYCPECNACYCRTHWQQVMEFDEGSTIAPVAPALAAHTRTLDD
ncbi:MAG TPA: hypothetical protein VFS20_33505 [Longimicrobium sp.]|nr:hypothetical protein [Longimicrobium sp.]